MTRLLARPVTLFILLAAITAAVMLAAPSFMSLGRWIVTALLALIGLTMAVRPERSGLDFHPTGVRLAGLFILGVLAFSIAGDLLTAVKG